MRLKRRQSRKSRQTRKQFGGNAFNSKPVDERRVILRAAVRDMGLGTTIPSSIQKQISGSYAVEPLKTLLGVISFKTADQKEEFRQRLTGSGGAGAAAAAAGNGANFNSKSVTDRREILRSAIEEMGLLPKVSKRLMYEIAGRPGYDLEKLRDIVPMIAFDSEEQQAAFVRHVNSA